MPSDRSFTPLPPAISLRVESHESAGAATATPRHEAGASSFASAVLAVSSEARKLGLIVPSFRSPPRPSGAVRTIVRAPGGPIVAIAVRGRTASVVGIDVVDGVLAANPLPEQMAADVRRRLLAAMPAHIRGQRPAA